MPVTDMITSAANPLVKRIRALADRRSRRREGAFVVTGVQPVWRAIEADWSVDTLVVVPEVLPDSAAELLPLGRSVHRARTFTGLLHEVLAALGESVGASSHGGRFLG